VKFEFIDDGMVERDSNMNGEDGYEVMDGGMGADLHVLDCSPKICHCV